MFKFTQLRPVNGIDVINIRKKHIPLYEGEQETPLLKSLKKKGITALRRHIKSVPFKKRLANYEALFDREAKQSDLSKLALVLQKAINVYKFNNLTFLGEGNNDFNKIVEFTINTGKELGLNFNNIESEIAATNIDTIRDDCYALLLQSSLYPEYRRFVETIYRILYIVNTENIDNLSDANSITDEGYLIIKKFLTARLLLPNGVFKEKMPLPEFKSKKPPKGVIHIPAGMGEEYAFVAKDAVNVVNFIEGRVLDFSEAEKTSKPLKKAQPIKSKAIKRSEKSKPIKKAIKVTPSKPRSSKKGDKK